MSSRSAYPWFFFYRIARLTLVVFLPTLFLILFLYRSSFRSGLISQMTMQTKSDLSSTRHLYNIDSCKKLNDSDSEIIIARKDGSVICKSSGESTQEKITDFPDEDFDIVSDLKKNSETKSQAIVVDAKIGPDLILRKIIPTTTFKTNMNKFDRVLFLRIVPFAFLSYLVFVFFFYQLTKPLGVILSKVEKFKDDIPFHKNIELLYQRDEWGSIEEALNKADLRLQLQIEEAAIENEKTSAILESINDAIIAIDKFESILFFNSRFETNFVKKTEGKEINKKVWHIFSNEVLRAFKTVLSTGEPISIKAMKFPDSNSPERFYDLKITPISSSRGVTGVLGVFYDVTDFKLTEQMRVDFVANVSHEIRTPLTSIKGFTQILQSQSSKVDPGLHSFLEKIVTNTERMISLFNDLLNLSVIESKNALHSEEFSLMDIVDAVEGNIHASYPDKKVTFGHELKLEHLKGDFRLIEQVVLNLCDNACKYAGDKVHIDISSYKKDNSSFVTIKDNGPGIAKEHLPRIFERFYRVDASRESLRGTGLGLAIVKQIILKHRGRIWAESEGLGFGTTFVIELPAV